MMSESNRNGSADSELPTELAGDEEMEELLRRAVSGEAAPPVSQVLTGVQDRLRRRSGGKFYSDGWSRTRLPPISTFFISSLMMIAVVVLIYAILVPVVPSAVEAPSNSTSPLMN